MAAMGESQDQNHNWLKRTQRLITHLPKNILVIPKTSGFLPVTSEKKWRFLEWPNQSLDLNQIEVLSHDLKQAVHSLKSFKCSWIKTILHSKAKDS